MQRIALDHVRQMSQGIFDHQQQAFSYIRDIKLSQSPALTHVPERSAAAADDKKQWNRLDLNMTDVMFVAMDWLPTEMEHKRVRGSPVDLSLADNNVDPGHRTCKQVLAYNYHLFVLLFI